MLAIRESNQSITILVLQTIPPFGLQKVSQRQYRVTTEQIHRLLPKLRQILQPEVFSRFTANCAEVIFETPDTYYQKLMNIYGEDE